MKTYEVSDRSKQLPKVLLTVWMHSVRAKKVFLSDIETNIQNHTALSFPVSESMM